FATASLAFVTSPAMAADMLSVGVGGYMQQWFGMSSVDDTSMKKDEMVNDGIAQQSDSEIFFRGKLESDSGLTFSVKVELEANSGKAADGKNTGVIDESQLTIGGEFGKITLGAEDPASTLTHHGGLDVGISLNCGDTHKWVGGLAGCSHNGFGTYGHGHGDKNQIMYFSPRVSGVQFGLSYIPDTGQEGGNEPLNDNQKDAWAIGGNYVGDFGGTNIAFSLGHYQGSQDGEQSFISGAAPAGGGSDNRITVGKLAADKKTWETLEYATQNDKKNKLTGLTGDTPDARDTALTTLVHDGLMARKNIMDATDGMMKKADSKTFSNAALQVGLGSFSFGIVYATADGGAYKAMDKTMVVNANDASDRTSYLALLNETPGSFETSDTSDLTTGVAARTTDFTGDAAAGTGVNAHVFDTGKETADGDPIYAVESATNNDPNNDIVMQTVGKDMSKDWDTWGAGVKYSDGPMAMSLSHLATEWDDGGEQEATMLSMSYTLAPGVASKTSLFTAERSTAKGRKIDGTGFVTGIVIGF
ncbi:MAG: porin, partial [Chloroflexi bacterium]|nr:porin [Chloroflexota bacterium]